MLRNFIKLNALRVFARGISLPASQIDETSLIEFKQEDLKQLESVKKLSRAMKNYLKKSEEFGKQMVAKGVEFEIGKRHLANMMGLDPETLNQKAIDEAIEYLLPSGLYSLKARPKMKPPEELFPKHKELQFDAEGKPFNTFFYTTKANFYSLIYDIAEKLEELDEYRNSVDTTALKSGVPSKAEPVELAGTKIMDKGTLEKNLLETISEVQYSHFVSLLKRLCEHPFAGRAKDFILSNLGKLDKVNVILDIPPIKKDDTGRLYAEAFGKRKTCWAHATLTELSTPICEPNSQGATERGPSILGNSPPMTVNGGGVCYFADLLHRGQLILPLTFTNKLGQFGIDVKVQEGDKLGISCQVGAARLAIARALTAFLNKNQIEELRLAGLLSYDVRTRERKKPGQKGARAKYKWRKR